MSRDGAIAIIGMAGRFPDADSVEEFWCNLRDGVDSLQTVPEELMIGAGVDPELVTDPTYIRARARLQGAELFDDRFFDLTPHDAALIDPQHRQFLECCWIAMEDGGYGRSAGRGRVSVFAGASPNSYLDQCLAAQPELADELGPFKLATANGASFLATRVSHLLDLRGISVGVATACSTSLVAIHMACQSILYGESDLALAGGAAILLPQEAGFHYVENGILSPDGSCRPFDAGAQGTAVGAGVGVVLLKSLDRALADRDPIRAIILGTAVNNDGKLKVGFTAPSVSGQADVISEALEMAGVAADSITCIEAHGTGTHLGDPIEVEALRMVFGGHRRPGICALGSVKSNIGHADVAAGVAGLIKTVLALEHRTLPPSLHFHTSNPACRLEESPFFIPTKARPWKSDQGPRRAGVSSFGLGGTNAHAVLEESPPVPVRPACARPAQLLIWSARTPAALERATENLHDHLERNPRVELADVAYTLALGRTAFRYRSCLECRDIEEAVRGLRERPSGQFWSGIARDEPTPLAFVFADDEVFDPAAAARLQQLFPQLQPRLKELLEQLEPSLAASVGDLLTCEATAAASNNPAQAELPSIGRFLIDLALARLWISWGLEPGVLAGGWRGQWLAACLASNLTSRAGAAPLRALSAASSVAAGDALLACLQAAPPVSAGLPIYSLGLGRVVTAEEVSSPAYWAGVLRNMSSPVDTEEAFAKAASVRSIRIDAGTAGAEDALMRLGRLWCDGADIDWKEFFAGEPRRRVRLPSYPFERRLCRIEPVARRQQASSRPARPSPPAAVGVRQAVEQLFLDITGIDAAALEGSSFYHMGVDSLTFVQINRALAARLGVSPSLRQLTEELSTVDDLVEWIEAHRATESAPVRKQLVDLQPDRTSRSRDRAVVDDGAADNVDQVRKHGPFAVAERSAGDPFSPTQRAHLDAFITSYAARTAKSKALADRHRKALADPRIAVGFRSAWKELVYPIAIDTADGAYVTDLDGNRYIDLVMGFGVNLFGHNPRFVKCALEQELARGPQMVGAHLAQAGEVAERLCRFTGADRVALCNTGSEAVTTAVRLARAVTGRDRVVAFHGAYHGNAEGFLARGRPGPVERPLPVSIGIPREALANVTLLDYGSEASLDYLRAAGDTVAAVLVEPIQSRRPDLQPVEFLQELRRWTRRTGTALIFDEMVTGFRLHPRGAQGHFGVDADLCTYGKVLGGGMPFGVVAGDRRYLDAVDGGSWHFGDGSGPTGDVAFFAGTFCKHPLTLAATLAVIDHLETAGASLQHDLNRRAERLSGRLNELFARSETGMSALHAGSILRLLPPADNPVAEMLFYQLRHHGISVWNDRPYFLSTAHSDEDLDRIVAATQDSIEAMNEAEFWKPRAVPDRSRAQLASASGSTPRAAGPARFPLTGAQLEIWLACQLGSEASCAYNVVVGLRLAGATSASGLDRAVKALMARHEALRTTFTSDGETQIVHRDIEPDIVTVDLSDRELTVGLAELKQRAEAEALRPFDLSSGPLLRATVVRLADEQCAVVLATHHIVCDGVSSELLLTDLVALSQGHQAAVPPGFPRFVAESLTPEAQGRRQSALAYWTREFVAPAPAPGLPGARSRPGRAPMEAETLELVIDQRDADALRSVAADYRCTLSTLLLAVFQLFLSRLTGQAEIVTGIIVSEREPGELENVFGHAVNLLPLRTTVTQSGQFSEFVRTVALKVMDAFEHRHCSLGSLLRALPTHRDPDAPPLITATFNLSRIERVRGVPGLHVERLPSPMRFSRFDLAADIADTGRELSVQLHYRSDRFAPAIAGHWVEHYRALLDEIRDHPTAEVRRLECYSRAQRSLVLQRWNDTAIAFDRSATLWSLFAAAAERYSAGIAIIDGDQRVSYGALAAAADRIAAQLVRAGVEREELVGLLFPPCAAMIAAVLGVLKSGCAYLPMDPHAPSQRLHHMIEDSGCRVVLCCGQPPALPGNVTVIDLGGTHFVDHTLPAAVVSDRSRPENLAYLLYTSGSTGRPKGVLVEQRGVAQLIACEAGRFGFTERDVWVLSHFYGFDVSVWEIFGALFSGGRLVVPDRAAVLDPRRLAGIIHAEGVTVLCHTPTAFLQLAPEMLRFPESASSLRHLILCGEALRPALLADWRAAFPTVAIANVYGITETTVYSSFRDVTPEDVRDDVSNIGGPLANTSFHLLDGDLRPVPIGAIGEIYVGGLGVARGYHRRPGLTAERFLPDPFAIGSRLYRSGDLGRYLADGSIEFLGRNDHQIKIRGFRVESGEIEAALRGLAGVDQAVVLYRQATASDGRLVAYFTRDGDPLPARETLRQDLAHSLPDYMIPGAFVEVDALPLTASGKVDRVALSRLYVDDIESATRFVAPRSSIEQLLVDLWRELLGRDGVGVHDNFFDLGGHSILVVNMQRLLRQRHGYSVAITDLFRHTTVARLAAYLSGGGDSHPVLTSEPPAMEAKSSGAIAIIGMAGRFPGASDLAQFWDNLLAGIDSISRPAADELIASGVDASMVADPRFVRAMGLMDDVDRFDAELFDVSPADAEIIDPQFRLLLECAWQALQEAGYAPEKTDARIGVFAGMGIGSYLFRNLHGQAEATNGSNAFRLAVSNDKDFLPAFVAYKLGLNGPSVNVQSGCSTSLVVLHTARRALLAGDCRLALAGAVTVRADRTAGYVHEEGMILSADGKCRAFDVQATGTVDGEGVGVVVLKRLEEAIADGDVIRAVIRGTAVNNDGVSHIGFTAPGVDGQADVIELALRDARISPDDVSYVECHGTGTALGDPIELEALGRAFAGRSENAGPCTIGSVKTNIGHADTAAGMAGLIKTVLALEHETLPPSLHFSAPNPHFDFKRSPFRVQTEAGRWTNSGAPRRAGVSSFGIGGTNAHVILEQAPEHDAAPDQRSAALLTLSARNETDLDHLTDQLATRLETDRSLALGDVAFTLAVGRSDASHRRTLIVRRGEAPAPLLRTPASDRLRSAPAGSERRPTAFLFPGQGTQQPNMGRSAYREHLPFRRAVDECAELLAPHLGLDLRTLLYPENGAAGSSALRDTRLAQPAVFVTDYAFAKLWTTWGVEAEGLLGHSIGEYVAATLAGIFTLQDALALVALRGKLMASMEPGEMLAVAAPLDQAREFAGTRLDVAAVNAPNRCVLSGPAEEVDRLRQALDHKGVPHRTLETSHAFHSRMMDPMLSSFAAAVRKVALSPPRLSVVSNVTGAVLRDAEATDPDYWVTHLRGTVRFADGLTTLLRRARPILLETGAGGTLSALARAHPAAAADALVIPSLPTADAAIDQQSEQLLDAVGQYWIAGGNVNWAEFYADQSRRRVRLPLPRLRRQRYWIEAPGAAKSGAAAASLGSQSAQRNAQQPERRALEDWFYLPQWRPLLPTRRNSAFPAGESVLLFEDSCGLGEALTMRIAAGGARVVRVRAGDVTAESAPDRWTLAADVPDDYALLLRSIGEVPQRIIHLWSVGDVGLGDPDRVLRLGFFSLLHLARALGRIGSGGQVEATVVADGLDAVTGAERLVPEKAALVGPATVMSQEDANLRCRVIDIEPVPTTGSAKDAVADRLLAEILARDAPRQVSLRNGQRSTRDFVPVRVLGDHGNRIRDNGVYLITGGLGGIGLVIARHLAEQYHARLVLTARTMPAAEPPALREMIARGTELLVRSADVTDAEAMAAVAAEAVARFGAIHGVIHAAGVAGAGLIITKDTDEARRVIAPKVMGARVLGQLCAVHRPDFLALFSSLAAVAGGIGQADYCGANAALDCFAHAASGAGDTAVVSIGWDTWAEVGMAHRFDVPAGYESQHAARAALAIRPSEGAEAFVRAVGAGVAHVLVSPTGTFTTVGSIPELRIEQRSAAARQPRPPSTIAHVAPGGPTEQQLCALWGELLGYDGIGANDDFFILGGDSLLATQIVSALRVRLRVELPIGAIFEYPTPAALARRVDNLRIAAAHLDDSADCTSQEQEEIVF
jgi:amino acid adenylation domain-containing protein